jgi:hypothetical protein
MTYIQVVSELLHNSLRREGAESTEEPHTKLYESVIYVLQSKAVRTG